ncbi:MAG: exopolysaccharide biosynthesis protein [Janthinobacterium lividum]
MTRPLAIPPYDEKQKFSDVLEGLSHGASPHLKLGELVSAFGERGFGALVLLLSLLALFPWPPGSKAIFSIPIILISAEMALQMTRVWLPRAILNRQVSRATYRRLLHAPIGLPRWLRRRLLSTKRSGFRGWLNRKVAVRPDSATPISVMRRVEKLTRPRYPMLTGEVADVLIGVSCIFLAIMMALPVPGGDMLPGFALALFGMGVLQRDGLFILAGAAGTLASGIYFLFVWRAAVAILTGIADWFGNLF